MTPTGDPRGPRRARPPRAVLFDFDGVLADTENHHVAAWQRTFEALGWAVGDADCARAAELDDRAFLREVFAARRVEGDVEGWVRRKQELTLMMLRDSPRVYPGVARLVGRLKGHARLGVVTTTVRANVEAVLAAAGLAGAFAVVVAGDDVPAPKPAADPYRKAVRDLHLSPADAVALEDSPTGLAAARAAHVAALAVGHRRPPGDWVGDAPYLPDLDDTAAALRLLGFPAEGPGGAGP